MRDAVHGQTLYSPNFSAWRDRQEYPQSDEMCTRSEMQHVDVVVVGLGPTGAALAGMLGQRGLTVAAFDRLADLYPSPRAIGFDHDFMRVMQELGIADRALPHTARYRPSEYRGVDGQLIKRLDAAPRLTGWAGHRTMSSTSRRWSGCSGTDLPEFRASRCDCQPK